MRERDAAFDRELDAFFPGVIGLIGGGGKTSLLFALAEALAAGGERVLCTTTTRMMLPKNADWLSLTLSETLDAVPPPPSGALFAARPPDKDADAAKVRGYAGEAVDDYSRANPDLRILVEADGAARKPVKAPAMHEPVVPTLATAVIAVVGLRCVGEPLSAEIAFRAERIAEAADARCGEMITPDMVARLATSPEGMFRGTPPHAARLLFCNQTDVPGGEDAARAICRTIARLRPGFLRGAYAGALATKGLRCLSFPTR